MAMAVHKLFIDELDAYSNYQLVAIHCSLEDYRLAYLLNGFLNLKLKRNVKDLDFSEANYSIYEWEDQKLLITWNLVSNLCKIEKNQQADTTSLFTTQNNVVTTYNLIPEHKEANYLLKIGHETNFYKLKKVIDILLSIPQIVTAYSIDTINLKSKTNLIFN